MAEGIIRRVDELGRIVIPKEIRKTFRLYEGSSLNINVQKSGEIILTKYSKLSSIYEFANLFCDCIYSNLECNVIICDCEKIIASNKKSMASKELSENVINIFFNRKNCILHKDNSSMMVSLFSGDNNIYTSQGILPIISDGDVIGGIILYTLNDTIITPEILKCCQIVSCFIGEV